MAVAVSAWLGTVVTAMFFSAGIPSTPVMQKTMNRQQQLCVTARFSCRGAHFSQAFGTFVSREMTCPKIMDAVALSNEAATVLGQTQWATRDIKKWTLAP